MQIRIPIDGTKRRSWTFLFRIAVEFSFTPHGGGKKFMLIIPFVRFKFFFFFGIYQGGVNCLVGDSEFHDYAFLKEVIIILSTHRA